MKSHADTPALTTPPMRVRNDRDINLLKTLLWIYIVMCFVVAGLNYGVAPKASEQAARTIAWIWMIYENWVKTLFIMIGSVLTLRVIRRSKRSEMRKKNLIGFTLAALVIHLIAPILTGNYELYFYAMPFPWTTTPLRLLDPASAFYQTSLASWGAAGIGIAVIVYVVICAVVFVCTLLFGRRFQCSTVCLFNGFAAEVFGPAIPLIGKRRQQKPETIRVFAVIRWVFFGVALLFFAYWGLRLLHVPLPVPAGAVEKIETYKYLSAELLAAIFFWIAYSGRGYCTYCPLGTVLGLLSRLADQKISVAHTRCVKCGRCDEVCPMSIPIRQGAVSGTDIRDIRCVGCGHCMDACPTGNLLYSTRFLDRLPGQTVHNKQDTISETDGAGK